MPVNGVNLSSAPGGCYARPTALSRGAAAAVISFKGSIGMVIGRRVRPKRLNSAHDAAPAIGYRIVLSWVVALLVSLTRSASSLSCLLIGIASVFCPSLPRELPPVGQWKRA